MSITNRLNYFTGFFTTARDWNEGQDYHIQKRKLHNRRLHTPGIVAGEGADLWVAAVDRLTVSVLPGAALDGEGNELYLSEARVITIDPSQYTLPGTVYIRASYGEAQSHFVQNMETPQYSGYTRISEEPVIALTTQRPDNSTGIELARIHLQEGVTVISEPVDPLNPVGNDIDRRYAVYAGAVGLTPEKMPFVLREHIISLMMRIRKDFAALDTRFPVPSSADARHGAMTVEMLARTDSITRESLAGIIASLASVELDLAQEIADRYPPVSHLVEFDAYHQRVEELIQAIRDGENPEALLNREDRVGIAARELAEAIMQLPVADSGPDFTVNTDEGQADVLIDAGNSHGFGGREIVRYHWRFPDLYTLPEADAGLENVTVVTEGENGTIVLDARNSEAFGGKGIFRYHWSIREEE